MMHSKRKCIGPGAPDVRHNGETRDFRMYLDQILQSTFLQELVLVILRQTTRLRFALDLALGILFVFCTVKEPAAADPHIFGSCFFSDNMDLIGRHTSGTEANSRLSNHGNATFRTHASMNAWFTVVIFGLVLSRMGSMETLDLVLFGMFMDSHRIEKRTSGASEMSSRRTVAEVTFHRTMGAVCSRDVLHAPSF